MKKFVSMILIGVCTFVFSACKISNSEIANTLESNMTRLVYSVSYLDTFTGDNYSFLGTGGNTANIDGLSSNTTGETSDVGLDRKNLASNGLQNNSELGAEILSGIGTGITGTETNLNGTSGLGGISSTGVNDGNLKTADTGASTLGGTTGIDGSTGTGSGISTRSFSFANGDARTNILGGLFNNGFSLMSSSRTFGNSNINTTGNLQNANMSNSNLTLGDTSLILANKDSLNNYLTQISERRSVIMLYCNDIRTGNIVLTEAEKQAISEYIIVLREVTNYVNSNTGAVTKYMNGINAIEDYTNSVALVNAKVIRVNDLLNTRHLKLETAISALDGVLEIFASRGERNFNTQSMNQNKINTGYSDGLTNNSVQNKNETTQNTSNQGVSNMITNGATSDITSGGNESTTTPFANTHCTPCPCPTPSQYPENQNQILSNTGTNTGQINGISNSAGGNIGERFSTFQNTNGMGSSETFKIVGEATITPSQASNLDGVFDKSTSNNSLSNNNQNLGGTLNTLPNSLSSNLNQNNTITNNGAYTNSNPYNNSNLNNSIETNSGNNVNKNTMTSSNNYQNTTNIATNTNNNTNTNTSPMYNANTNTNTTSTSSANANMGAKNNSSSLGFGGYNDVGTKNVLLDGDVTNTSVASMYSPSNGLKSVSSDNELGLSNNFILNINFRKRIERLKHYSALIFPGNKNPKIQFT